MSDNIKDDELVVLAGSVQVKRMVGAGEAFVDVAQGEPVGEIDDETRTRLLDSGAIGRRDGQPYDATGARPVPGEVEPDEIPGDLLPGGSVEAILGWVGDDLARARVARDMELAKGLKARATLLKALDEVKASVETEPPAVPEVYDPTVQPAAPAAEVVTASDDAADESKPTGAESKSSTAGSKSAAAKPKS